MTIKGSLERLGQPVSAVMTDTFITLPHDAVLREAARAMRDRGIGLVLVTDGDDLVGVLSERDIATAVADGDDCDVVALADRARGDIITVAAGSKIQEAVERMAAEGIRHLVVIDQLMGQPAGIVSARDVLAELSRI